MDEESHVTSTPSCLHPFWRLPTAITFNDRRKTSPIRRRVVRKHRRRRLVRNVEDDANDDDNDEDDDKKGDNCSQYFRDAYSRVTDDVTPSTRSPGTELDKYNDISSRGCHTSYSMNDEERNESIISTTPGVITTTDKPITNDNELTQYRTSSTVSFSCQKLANHKGDDDDNDDVGQNGLQDSASLFVNDVIMGPTRPNLGRNKSHLRRVDSCCEKYVKAQLIIAGDTGNADGVDLDSSQVNNPHNDYNRFTKAHSSSFRADRPKTTPLSTKSRVRFANVRGRSKTHLTTSVVATVTTVPKTPDRSITKNYDNVVPNENTRQTILGRASTAPAGGIKSGLGGGFSLEEMSNSVSRGYQSGQWREDCDDSTSSEDLDDFDAAHHSDDDCESDAFDTDCEPDIKSEFRHQERTKHQTRSDQGVGYLLYLKACKESRTKPREKIKRQLYSKKVDLRHGGLLAPEAAALMMALKINTRVEEIDLSHNSLPPTAACDVIAMITNNMRVHALSIGGNQLADDACARQGNEMLNLNAWLTFLDLSDCMIGDSQIAIMAQGIQDNKGIQTLKLSKNKIGITGALLLGRALGMNEVLKELDLSWNQIRGAGAVAVCNSLKKNVTIEWLDLSWNGIGFEGSLALGEAIRVNRKLKYLNLENNRINWDCAPFLTKALMVNRTLEVLMIGQNPISMEGCEDIIQALSRTSSSVRTLSLAGIPINTKIALLATDVAKTREFSMDHGGILTTNDVMSSQHSQKADPFILLIRYLSLMGIRVMDLFRMFDKDNRLCVTRSKFIQGLKRVRVPLDDDDILKVARRLQSNKRGNISYQELANMVRSRIREERIEDKRIEMITRKKQEERKRILQSDKPLTAGTSVNYLPALYNLYSHSGKGTRSTCFSPSVGSLAFSRRGSMLTPLPILKSAKNTARSGYQSTDFGLRKSMVTFNNKNIVSSNTPSSVTPIPKGQEVESSVSYVSQLKRQNNREIFASSRHV